MKTLIFILILLALLQTTIIPLNLVLMVIIIRSYIRVDKANFYLAFSVGLLVSFLESTTLGLYSIIYLFVVEATHLFSKTPMSKNLLAIVPLALFLLNIADVALSVISRESIQLWPKIAFEGILILPIYMALRFWEERFIVKPEFKLKI